jgi:uncharacterized protein (DUF302 family)
VATDDPHGLVTLGCDEGVDRLLRRAVASIEAHGLEVFEVIDHSGDAAEVGLTMPDTKLVLFAHPQTAAELMLIEPRAAIDLPFKLLICEGHAGDVFVSYNSPAFLMHRHRLTDGEAVPLRLVETIARETRAR